MGWKKVLLPVAALAVASVAIGTCASLVRRAARRSTPEVRCVVEFLDALEAGEVRRLEGLVAAYRPHARSNNYAPRLDPAAFGKSAEAKEIYLRAWADRALASLRRAGVERPSAARVAASREVKDPKGTEVVLEYKTPAGRVALAAVVAQFPQARLAFVAREDWRARKAQGGVVRPLLRAPSNVYLVDPGLMKLVGGRMPLVQYPAVGAARGLPTRVAGNYVVMNRRGVFIAGPDEAGEPLERDSFADAAARARGGAKAMLVFADGAIGYGIVGEVLEGLSRAGFEEAAFVARAKRPASAQRQGNDCYGIVRCVLGARVDGPDLLLAPVISAPRWVVVDEEGTAKTIPLSPAGATLGAMLESAARGAGARLHLPPETTLGLLLPVLQFFGEEPLRVELSGALPLKVPEGLLRRPPRKRRERKAP